MWCLGFNAQGFRDRGLRVWVQGLDLRVSGFSSGFLDQGAERTTAVRVLGAFIIT